MQSERERAILREVVEMFIASGDAVGSRTIAARLNNELSSASIRNTMSALCDQGLLEKPHTSAGRVPTDLGYRAYLDGLVVPGDLPANDVESVSSLDWSDGFSALDVLRGAAHALSEGMGVASLIFAPRLESAVLQRIEFVWLTVGRVLSIAVTRGGLVHERLLRVDASVRREDLEGLTNYLNTLLPGRTLGEMRAVIEAEQARDREAHTALEEQALDFGRRALDNVEQATVLVDGAARILEAKEFVAAPEKAVELLRALEQRAQWLELLERVADADDTEVYIGRETGQIALAPCALVASRYESGGGVGVVALVGPKRLDYRRAIPLVRFVAARLSVVLRGRVEDLEA